MSDTLVPRSCCARAKELKEQMIFEKLIQVSKRKCMRSLMARC